MRLHDLNIMSYDDAQRLQRRTVLGVQEERQEETLFFVEHPHVITRGRNATSDSLLASRALLEARGVSLAETDRGGDVTYHGPGQLVGYPIIRLEGTRRDIRRFVHDLEEVLLRTLADFGIEGRRDDVHRGVWVGDRKIASVGIRIARWVTSHGFALNVDTDLSYFTLIHPCGIAGCDMTSMTRELQSPVDMSRVKRVFAGHFSDVYDRQIVSAMSPEGALRNG